ncbi:MAG TPA: ASCH domain-containing protein [Terriglobales bacterium]
MRALSLHQPWASLIHDGRKKIETRGWEMLFRGPLAIHAAKTVNKFACEQFGYDPLTVPLGAILCIVDVVGCVRLPHELAPPDEYGNFEAGRFGILLTMRRRLEMPVLAKGHQGIWHWTESSEAEASA